MLCIRVRGGGRRLGCSLFNFWSFGLILATILVAPAPALAATFYVCDCGALSAEGCVPGNDLLDGTGRGTAWRTYEKARTEFPRLAPGDSLKFCRGGQFEIQGGVRWINSACHRDRRCSVRDYRPHWGRGGERRPIIIQTSDFAGHGFALEDGGFADHEEGYLFANLDIRNTAPPGGSGIGFFLYNDIDDVIIRNVHVEGFRIGVFVAGSNECSDDPDCDGRNDRISLRTSTLMYNWEDGWLGSSSGTTVADNYFEGNGTRLFFDHNIYVGDNGYPTTGMRVLRNRSQRSSPTADGVCRGNAIVAHGTHDDLQIVGNMVLEELGHAEQACWGIAADPGTSRAESFSNLRIAGNTVVNVGSVGIGVASCADCVIENNVVIQEQPHGIRGISIPDVRSREGDGPLERVTVRNNSIYVSGDLAGSTGIQLDTDGSGHVVANNAVAYSGAGASWNCFSADLVAGRYAAFEHNVCAYPDTASDVEWVNKLGSLGDWQLVSGLGVGSVAVSSLFGSPDGPDFDLMAASPTDVIVDTASIDSASRFDLHGHRRDALPDVGAFEDSVDSQIGAGTDGLSRSEARRAAVQVALDCIASDARTRNGVTWPVLTFGAPAMTVEAAAAILRGWRWRSALALCSPEPS